MTVRAALACSLAFLAAGCSSSPSVRDCSSDSDCGPGNVCHLGSCAGNEPPTASFVAPVSATTNRIVSLAAASTDPEGRPLEHRWSIRAVSAGCEPDLEPAAGSGLDVAFWCPGTYEATLVSIDDLGAEGAPVTRTFGVAEAVGAPTVVAGLAIPAQHLCDLGLPACTVNGPDGSPSLQLAASATDPGGASLTYEWTAIPPAEVAADPALEVTFALGSFVAAPTVSIQNAGGPIAGVHRFRVRVRNPSGLLAQALQEVVVDNHAPTAAPGTLALGHLYANGLYVAEGEVETGASDPDGDLIAAGGVLTPSPPAGCTEEVVPAGAGRLSVRIACSVASALIGQVARTLSVAIVDANGASTSFAAPLVITNRPPLVLLNPAYADGHLAVDHRVEPCVLATGASCFVADGADPFVTVDPDGDPLPGLQIGASVAANRSSSKGTATVDGATYRFRFETPTGLPGQFRSVQGATGFTVSGLVTDPFGATGSLALLLAVRNRGPILTEPLASVSVPHSYDAADRRYRASAETARFEDPDGDPILLTVTGSTFCSSATLVEGRAVVGCSRAWDYTLGGVPPLAELLVPQSLTVTASDGWESVGAGTTVTVLDRPATVTAPMATAENCVCEELFGMIRYVASGSGFHLPAFLADPDGDPSLVKVQPNQNGSIPPLPTVCIPGWCYPSGDVYGTIAQGTVSATAGVGMVVSAPFSISITCSFANQGCL